MSQNNVFDQLRLRLLEEVNQLDLTRPLPESFTADFFKLIEMAVFSLMHKEDNFFGSCMIQMKRGIKLDLSSGAGVSADVSFFNIYFNPLILLPCSLEEIRGIIKHQIYHIMFRHLERFQTLQDRFSPLLLNTGMDLAINQFIDCLPQSEITLEEAERKYGVELKKDQPFEVYCEILQMAMDSTEDSQEKSMDAAEGQEASQEKPWEQQDHSQQHFPEEERKVECQEDINDIDSFEVETSHREDSCHDIWGESSRQENFENLKEMTQKLANQANQGEIPAGIKEVIRELNRKPQVQWQDILRKTVGTLPVPYKKTITRKDRRQPERLDLRGRLSNRLVQVIIALDTSASMGEQELQQGLAEIFSILKLYRHKVTVIECGNKIEKVYTARSPRDIQIELKGRGGTAFSPVFEYINRKQLRNHLLIYFTDGFGEEGLTVKPLNYRTLWVLTGSENRLSLKKPYGWVKSLKTGR